jgi:hypothetical protein
VNTEAEDAVLGHVHVLVAEQLLLGVRVHSQEQRVQEVGQQHL